MNSCYKIIAEKYYLNYNETTLYSSDYPKSFQKQISDTKEGYPGPSQTFKIEKFAGKEFSILYYHLLKTTISDSFQKKV